MLTAVILICSLTSVPNLEACTQDNASAVIRDTETFTCFMHGQAYVAATSIGRDLSENEVVKVLCVQSRMVATPSPAATSSPPEPSGNTN